LIMRIGEQLRAQANGGGSHDADRVASGARQDRSAR
jgi:hypothetical protein